MLGGTVSVAKLMTSQVRSILWIRLVSKDEKDIPTSILWIRLRGDSTLTLFDVAFTRLGRLQDASVRKELHLRDRPLRDSMVRRSTDILYLNLIRQIAEEQYPRVGWFWPSSRHSIPRLWKQTFRPEKSKIPSDRIIYNVKWRVLVVTPCAGFLASNCFSFVSYAKIIGICINNGGWKWSFCKLTSESEKSEVIVLLLHECVRMTESKLWVKERSVAENCHAKLIWDSLSAINPASEVVQWLSKANLDNHFFYNPVYIKLVVIFHRYSALLEKQNKKKMPTTDSCSNSAQVMIGPAVWTLPPNYRQSIMSDGSLALGILIIFWK